MSKLYPVHFTAEEMEIVSDALVAYVALHKGGNDKRDELAMRSAHKANLMNMFAQATEESAEKEAEYCDLFADEEYEIVDMDI